MLTHIDHAGDVLRRLRNFIRRGHPHVSTINTRDTLEEAMTLAQAEAFARLFASISTICMVIGFNWSKSC